MLLRRSNLVVMSSLARIPCWYRLDGLAEHLDECDELSGWAHCTAARDGSGVDVMTN